MPLFPTTVGAEWTYSLEALALRGSLVQRVESAVQTENGHELKISSMAELGGKVVIGEERLLVTPSAIFRLSGSMGTYQPSLCIYAERDWTWLGTVGEADNARANGRALSEGTLLLPAGRFITKASEVSVQFGSTYTTSRYWLSKGVGWVRIEHDMPGGILVAELKEFKPK
jgi:hypothetical protein